MKYILIVCIIWIVTSCNNQQSNMKQYPTTGSIERNDPALDAVIAPGTEPEIIAEGFDWSEGPLWLEKEQALIFSDVPANAIYKWSEATGKQLYLQPSGYTSSVARTGETGSNGLTLDPAGNLVLCQHGDRRMARMNTTVDQPKADFTTLADNYGGKKLNSPNDAVYDSHGDLYFTDPPYGLVTQNDSDPQKEIAFNGVYKVKPDGTVILLADTLTRPNGIAFFPGEQRILIANSDPAKPNWYVYDVAGDSLTNGRIFYSAAGFDSTWKGLPDGLKINRDGIVFASGPGGMYIFNSNGKKLGMIRLQEATSNCAFSADQRILYITNDMQVLRVKLNK